MTATATTSERSDQPSLLRRLSRSGCIAHRARQLGLLLPRPSAGWSSSTSARSFILLLSAFWAQDAFTGNVDAVRLDARGFETLFADRPTGPSPSEPLVMAIARHASTDALLAFPIAYYMARVASPRDAQRPGHRRADAAVGGYLVKVYAWRTILQGNGLLDWALEPFGSASRGRASRTIANSWLVLSYLWLPYMILPLYAGLERIPSSLLEASADLGGRA